MDDREEKLRERLQQLLKRSVSTHEALVRIVTDPNVPASVVIDEAHRLERLELAEHNLFKELEQVIASTPGFQRRDERSVRQVVLEVLQEIAIPQRAAFLRDYIWARDRIPLETRRFGALRRDESRSWERNPGKRRAYITPALDPTAQPLTSWMTRSDWPLERRTIVSAEHKRLLETEKVAALLRARDLTRGDDRIPFNLALADLAPTLQIDISSAPTQFNDELLSDSLVMYDREDVLDTKVERKWRREFEAVVQKEIKSLHHKLDPEIRKAAAKLSSLPPEEQLWGRTSN